MNPEALQCLICCTLGYLVSKKWQVWRLKMFPVKKKAFEDVQILTIITCNDYSDGLLQRCYRFIR